MLKNYGLILALLNTARKINTRKKIQKIVFFMKMVNIPFSEKFSLHHFGPYSPELQLELDQLGDAGFITSEFNEFQNTAMGDSYLSEHGDYLALFADSNLREMVKALNEIEPFKLESMATIVFFEHSYGKNRKNLRIVLKGIKPHLDDVFDDAWNKLDEFNLHATPD